ncbi:linear amide C-N hydrolase [Candidatus Thorarchaeota archaeon]|nr:MAG: linear amide C-N hydrolase [Candidatus Thorarchaeota archaeon]
MNEITLRGTYSEMGEELGKLLHKSNYKPPPVPEERLELARGCESALEEYAPSLLEEIDAVVEAGKYEETSLKAFELSLGPYPEWGCSIFAVSGNHTTTGNVIFARNYDWESESQELFTVFRTYPEGALSSLTCTDLLVGRYGGINEAGLAIGLTAIPGSRRDHPGVMLHLVVRWVLDNCRTVKDAVAFIEKIPHVRGNNYLVADLQGDMALVQACPENVEVVGPVDGLVAATNHFQTSNMQAFEIDKYIPPSSVPRLEFIRKWFKNRRGKIDMPQAQSVLSGRLSTGDGVCQDIEWEGVRFATIWAWTYETGRRSLQIAGGLPCEVDFEEFSF